MADILDAAATNTQTPPPPALTVPPVEPPPAPTVTTNTEPPVPPVEPTKTEPTPVTPVTLDDTMPPVPAPLDSDSFVIPAAEPTTPAPSVPEPIKDETPPPPPVEMAPPPPAVTEEKSAQGGSASGGIEESKVEEPKKEIAEEHKPEEPMPPAPTESMPVEKPKAKRNMGVLIAGVLLMVVLMPLLVLFVRQQQEIRGYARECETTDCSVTSQTRPNGDVVVTDRSQPGETQVSTWKVDPGKDEATLVEQTTTVNGKEDKSRSCKNDCKNNTNNLATGKSANGSGKQTQQVVYNDDNSVATVTNVDLGTGGTAGNGASCTNGSTCSSGYCDPIKGSCGGAPSTPYCDYSKCSAGCTSPDASGGKCIVAKSCDQAARPAATDCITGQTFCDTTSGIWRCPGTIQSCGPKPTTACGRGTMQCRLDNKWACSTQPEVAANCQGSNSCSAGFSSQCFTDGWHCIPTSSVDVLLSAGSAPDAKCGSGENVSLKSEAGCTSGEVAICSAGAGVWKCEKRASSPLLPPGGSDDPIGGGTGTTETTDGTTVASGASGVCTNLGSNQEERDCAANTGGTVIAAGACNGLTVEQCAALALQNGWNVNYCSGAQEQAGTERAGEFLDCGKTGTGGCGQVDLVDSSGNLMGFVIDKSAGASCGGGGGGGGGGTKCVNIKAYGADGKAMNAAKLKALTAGQTVTFAFKGDNKTTKVRFRVNSTNDADWKETTTKNSAKEFVYTYTLPAGVANFSIEGQFFSKNKWH